MKIDTEIIYKGYAIYHNQWGEYCITDKEENEGRMVSSNASFPTLKMAKDFVSALERAERHNPMGVRDVEELAAKMGGGYNNSKRR